MKSRKKLYIKIIKYTLISFAFLIILYFSVRNSILNHFVEKKITDFNLKYHADLKIEKISLAGLYTIEISNISLKHKDRDTLIKAEKIIGKISFIQLLIGNIKLNEIQLTNFYIRIYKNHEINNYSFLLKNPEKEDTLENTAINYSEQAQKIINAFFDKLPSKIELQKFKLFVDIDKDRFSFYIHNFVIKDNLFNSRIYLSDNNNPELWILQGEINSNNRFSKIKLFSDNHKKIKLPYFSQTIGAKVQFDTLQFSLSNSLNNNNITTINGTASFDSIDIFHTKIASKDIILNNLKIDYTINIGDNFYELDSTTNITFNKISFNPYIKLRNKPSKQITLIIGKNNFIAQDLFESLPDGLFNNFEGIKTSGKLSYNLNFYVDFAKLDSIILESNLKKNNFRILKFGKSNLTFFNSPFTYTAYDKGIPVKTFDVGPENPDFRPIEQIPSFLKGAILTSEDGIFYYHNGFIVDAFKSSIADNIRAKRFVRGGSTISMQLVKNLFLTKNKSITRKLEEILIVWLIENNGLSTKDRMFEVYLNIIEFGPKIYGVNEASKYYFNKPVNLLTYAEAIFLASIIPHPKWFKYELNDDGSFKDYIINYYKDVSKKMLDKNFINQYDYDNLIPKIEIKGMAKFDILKADSIPSDSLMFYNQDFE